MNGKLLGIKEATTFHHILGSSDHRRHSYFSHQYEGKKRISFWQNTLVIVLHNIWMHESTTSAPCCLDIWFISSQALGSFPCLLLNYSMCNSQFFCTCLKGKCNKKFLSAVSCMNQPMLLLVKPLGALVSLSVRWTSKCLPCGITEVLGILQ